MSLQVPMIQTKIELLSVRILLSNSWITCMTDKLLFSVLLELSSLRTPNILWSEGIFDFSSPHPVHFRFQIRSLRTNQPTKSTFIRISIIYMEQSSLVVLLILNVCLKDLRNAQYHIGMNKNHWILVHLPPDLLSLNSAGNVGHQIDVDDWKLVPIYSLSQEIGEQRMCSIYTRDAEVNNQYKVDCS